MHLLLYLSPDFQRHQSGAFDFTT